MPSPYPLGAIVTASDPFGNSSQRPYLLVSNSTHPFFGNEYVGVVVTTKFRDEAIPLRKSAYRRGSLPRESFLNPWNPVTLKAVMIGKHAATVREAVVRNAVQSLNQYLG